MDKLYLIFVWIISYPGYFICHWKFNFKDYQHKLDTFGFSTNEFMAIVMYQFITLGLLKYLTAL
jgi:hypothetical protein